MSEQTQQISSAALFGTPALPSESSTLTPRSVNAEADEDGEPRPLSLFGYLMSSTAASYYLSLLLHLAGYGVATLAFVMLGHHLIETETVIDPIRASLDDFDRQAEQPQFEAIAQIELGSAQSESNIQRISNNLRAVENGFVDTSLNEALPSFAQSKNDTADDGSDGFLFKLPESGLAVTKGSFTVWTDPEKPRPGQRYLIIIEIRLPDGVKAYRISDLRGTVIGSDDYRQKIPYDSKAPDASSVDDGSGHKRISGRESVKVRENKVQLAIQVPGAQRLVRDRIQISSRRLREKQELELVFGGR